MTVTDTTRDSPAGTSKATGRVAAPNERRAEAQRSERPMTDARCPGRLVDYTVSGADAQLLGFGARPGEVLPATIAQLEDMETVALWVHADGALDPLYIEGAPFGNRPGEWRWRGPTSLEQGLQNGITLVRPR
jgi:hypothetical protein